MCRSNSASCSDSCSCGSYNFCPCSGIAGCIAEFKRILWIQIAVIVAVSVDQTCVHLYEVRPTISKTIIVII